METMRLEVRKCGQFDDLYELFFDGTQIGRSANSANPELRVWKLLVADFTAMQERIAELEELAGVVKFVEGDDNIAIAHDAPGWIIWHRDEIHDEGRQTGRGNTPVKALADYKRKHPPKPEDDTSLKMARYILKLYGDFDNDGWLAELVEMARHTVAASDGSE